MVPKTDENVGALSSSCSTKQGSFESPNLPTGSLSTPQNTKADDLLCVKKQLNKMDLSNDSVNIILASWRCSTKKQYNVYTTKWLKFCSDNSIDPDSANIESGIEFLTHLFKSNLGHSAINTARSATMIIDLNYVPFGWHVLVKRLMKGIFELRPALPKYSKT